MLSICYLMEKSVYILPTHMLTHRHTITYTHSKAKAPLIYLHCVNESNQCWMSLAASLMQSSISVKHASTFALTFSSVNVAIDDPTWTHHLTHAGNYVTPLGRLGSPRRRRGKIGCTSGNLVILCHERNLGSQKHLRPIHHDDNSRRDNKCECVKGTAEGEKLTLMLAANVTQMQRVRGALALVCTHYTHEPKNTNQQ